MTKTNNPGVYGILCLTNGKYYIGSSDAPRRRLNNHRDQLRRNEHYQLPRLQADWNAHGEDAFAFILFDHGSKEIGWYEDYLITTLKTLEHQQGYNKMSGGRWGIEARIRNTETKLVRYGQFMRQPGIPAETPMTLSYIETMVL